MTPEKALRSLDQLNIELPSWGFADTGTRFGKFFQKGSAINTADKFADAGMVNKVTGCCPTVAVHVLWDFVEGEDPQGTAEIAAQNGVKVGSINPNLFQDQAYKLGSFANPDAEVRSMAVRHGIDCAKIGEAVGSNLISYWFADGTNYPGQDSIRARKRRFENCLKSCYEELAEEQVMLIEYKPFEPAFYQTDIADWGMSFALCKKLGPQAKVLVDTGHHYTSQNIEQIVAWLLDEEMLGGFHFNDRRYADDDLTLGSIDPYQIFRIFNEIHGYAAEVGAYPEIAYMIDQSHNLKPKIEAMIQTVTTAQELWAKAALVDREALAVAQRNGNIVDAEDLLKSAYNTDVRPLLAQWREEKELDADPMDAYRKSGYLEQIEADRTRRREELGISQESSYA
ncbi:L-rhamnose isomerase [Pelagicoccus sp. SDUM812002]|uniref:L-rhamnose isomerase n=1 Tax=Pelagicoccus sp. SDUM812002 TaxID=3041266 RepID=UPI00280D1D15|nr:L-rhamnose isomerase [Pelagicoccus sp. SDUM812002]MDQ8188316.1 L-rhamnose isomerase [Pelagicoccus sp. SDUM812002]